MQSRPAGNRVISFVLGISAALPLHGCAPRHGVRDIPQSAAVGGQQRRSLTTTPLSVRVSDANQLTTIASVLVLPPSFSEQAQDSPRAGSLSADTVEAMADRELTVTVFGKRWVEGAPERARLVREAANAPTLTALRSHGVDAVLRTEITSFVERRGSAVGGEPAAVSFVMTLVRASDSRELWQGTYSYGQTFLSENLLQLGDVVGEKRRGPGWSSGREIFEAGVSSALRDLNSRREEQFLTRK